MGPDARGAAEQRQPWHRHEKRTREKNNKTVVAGGQPSCGRACIYAIQWHRELGEAGAPGDTGMDSWTGRPGSSGSSSFPEFLPGQVRVDMSKGFAA